MSMDDKRLVELEQMANGATPGPWKANTDAEILNMQHGDWYWMDVTQEDAEFIAATRTAVPELIAELRKLKSQMEYQAQAWQKERDINTAEIERLKAELERLAVPLRNGHS